MKTKLFILFTFLFTFSLSAQIDSLSFEEEWRIEKQQMILNYKINISEIYPYNQADNVEIIAFYTKQNDYENLLKNGKVNLSPDEIDDRKFLNGEQIYKLAQLFNNPLAEECNIYTNCYDPKHLIVFYDIKGKAFTFIEICLECFETFASDKKIKNHKICSENIELFYELLSELHLKSNPKHYNYLSEKSVEGLYKVEHRRKVGFLDENKNIIIPFMYDSEEYNEEIGKTIEYVIDNETGNTMTYVAYRHRKYTGFQWGASVVIKDGKYGLINTKNEIIVPFIYEGIDGINGEFSEDSDTYTMTNFIAKKNGKYGIVDINGNIIKDFVYSLIVGNNEYSDEYYYEE
jgi:hypothetical protein